MRVTLAFALGALVLSVTMAALTYQVARTYLLRQREASVLRQVYANANVVRRALANPQPDLPRLLSSLGAPGGSFPIVRLGDDWFAASLAVGRADLPHALRQQVAAGTPAAQRFSLDGVPSVAVGVPLPAVRAAYFEVFQHEMLNRTLQVLRASLAAGALATAVAGAGVGRWASRRLLNPLADVARAAEAVAGGRFDVRVEGGDDRDLATLAASFNRMTDTLKERMARDARFASSVSHELRSPLTTLATSLEVLKARRAELPRRSQEAVDLLASEVRRFHRLVEDLLEISRVDAGAAEVTSDTVRVGEFVRHAVRACSDRDVLVDVDRDAADLLLPADKRRLERVMANLMDNAETYGGGVVRVAAERGDGWVRIAVEDAGPGVPPAERERIFERFARGRGAARNWGEGTGLGLALVTEHVRLHSGRAWVEDRAGGGARFVVELPLGEP